MLPNEVREVMPWRANFFALPSAHCRFEDTQRGGTDTRPDRVAALGNALASASQKGVWSGLLRFHPTTNLRSEHTGVSLPELKTDTAPDAVNFDMLLAALPTPAYACRAGLQRGSSPFDPRCTPEISGSGIPLPSFHSSHQLELSGSSRSKR